MFCLPDGIDRPIHPLVFVTTAPAQQDVRISPTRKGERSPCCMSDQHIGIAGAEDQLTNNMPMYLSGHCMYAPFSALKGTEERRWGQSPSVQPSVQPGFWFLVLPFPKQSEQAVSDQMMSLTYVTLHAAG